MLYKDDPDAFNKGAVGNTVVVKKVSDPVIMCPHCNVLPTNHDVCFNENILQVFHVKEFLHEGNILTPVDWKNGYNNNPPTSHCVYRALLDNAIMLVGSNWLKKINKDGILGKKESPEKWLITKQTKFRMYTHPGCDNRLRRKTPTIFCPKVYIRAAVVYDIVPGGSGGLPCCWMIEATKEWKSDLKDLVPHSYSDEARHVWHRAFTCPHLNEMPSIVFGYFVEHQAPMAGRYTFVRLKPTVHQFPFCADLPDMTNPHEIKFSNNEFEQGTRVVGFLIVLGIDSYRVVSLAYPADVDNEGNATVEINPGTDPDIKNLPTRNTLGYYAYSPENAEMQFHVFTFLYPDAYFGNN